MRAGRVVEGRAGHGQGRAGQGRAGERRALPGWGRATAARRAAGKGSEDARQRLLVITHASACSHILHCVAFFRMQASLPPTSSTLVMMWARSQIRWAGHLWATWGGVAAHKHDLCLSFDASLLPPLPPQFEAQGHETLQHHKHRKEGKGATDAGGWPGAPRGGRL